MRALGRKTPPDFKHVEKYPLSAVSVPVATPVVLGVNWYEGFDSPVKGSDGRYRIRISGNVRGGHCICAEPAASSEQDVWSYHVFYDQGDEGACTGFGSARACSIVKRRTYDAFWVYDDARRIDGDYPGGEGSYVRSALQVLKQWGAHFESGEHCTRSAWNSHTPGTQIKSYHWATNAAEVASTLGYHGEVPLLNSWGTSYPETVWLSLEDVERLLKEEGEAGVPLF